MANPSYSNIHPVNEILKTLAIEAIPSDGQLIADQVIEDRPSQGQTDRTCLGFKR